MKIFKQLAQDASNVQLIIKTITEELVEAERNFPHDYRFILPTDSDPYPYEPKITFRKLLAKLSDFSETVSSLYDLMLDVEFLLFNNLSPESYEFDLLEYVQEELTNAKYLFFVLEEEVKATNDIVLSYSVSYLISQLKFFREEMLKDILKAFEIMKQKAA